MTVIQRKHHMQTAKIQEWNRRPSNGMDTFNRAAAIWFEC